MATHPMRAMLDAEVTTLQALVTAIKGQQGSAHKRLEAATHTALGQVVTINGDDAPKFGLDTVTGEVKVNLGSLAQYVADISSWAEQVANEAVSLILQADNSGDQLDALREQYKAKRELCDALMVVLKAEKVNVSDVEIPALRGAHGPRNTSAKSSHGRWYRVVKGVRKEQSDSQNNISSYAFYHGADVLQCVGQYSNNKGKGVPKDVFEKWLRENVTDSPLGKSWSVEVDGVTYGMDVKSSGEGSQEDTSEEE